MGFESLTCPEKNPASGNLACGPRLQGLLAQHGPQGVNAWAVTRPGRAGDEAWGITGVALEVHPPVLRGFLGGLAFSYERGTLAHKRLK